MKLQHMRRGLALAVAAVTSLAAVTARAADANDDLVNALGRDSEVTLHFRTYYFDRLNPGDVQNLAWAIGGWAGYQTGWIGNALRLGIVGYTSQPLYAPDDKGGTNLLKTPQEGYSVLGEAFVALKLWEQTLTGGRFRVNEPEINPQDNRMTPVTYQGGSLGGQLGGVSYFGAYLDAIKPRTNESFIDFAQAANVKGVSEPLWLIGLSGEPAKDFKLRFSSYYVPNVLSSTYGDAAWLTALSEDTKLRLGAQAMYQTSVGDDLLTGSAFTTYSGGVKIDLLSGPATLTLVYQQTGRGSAYNTPYATWAGYTSMIVKDFDQAGQKAWMLGAAYDFAKLGAPGFGLNGSITYGYDAINASTRAAQPNWTEYDLTADYRFSHSSWPEWARPFWIRGRAAYVDMGSSGIINDYRIIVNYEWVFK